MHRRRKADIYHNRRVVLIVASSLALVIAVCLTVIFTAGGSNGGTSTQIQNVVQPASAAQIASNLHCTNFKDLGGGMGVIDSGSCYIGADKYAIDTFPAKGVRDKWLDSATTLGVVPKWETDTSVTYPSVD